MKTAIVLSTQPASFEALAYKGDFERNVEKIARLGYDGVELAVRDPKLLDADHVEKVVGRLGLEVPAIGTGQAYGEEGLSFTDPDESVRRRAVERIAAQIRFARRFDALVIIGLLRGKAVPRVERERALAWLVEALRECAVMAEEEGIKLVLEPLNRYETDLVNSVAEALHLIEEVGSEAVGLLFDTFHANIEEPSIEGSIRTSGDRLLHVHVADSNRWYPGAGHLDFKAILDTLFATGYQGYISGEFMPLPDADTSAERSIAYLRQIYTCRTSSPTQ